MIRASGPAHSRRRPGPVVAARAARAARAALAALAALATLAAASAHAQPLPEPVMAADASARPSCTIVPDGVDDEPCWARAPTHTLPHEYRPVPGRTPTVQTRYRLLQEADHLCVWVEADDPEPGSIRDGLTRRDKVGNDQDHISLYIDPLGTRRFAQMFRVNPAGSVSDGTWNEASFQQSLDQDFDFEVGTRRTERGWSAEFRIPFHALRYASRNGRDHGWTLLVLRNHPRADRHVHASAPIHPNADCFLCRNPVLAGVVPPPSPRHWQATPHVLVREGRSHDDTGPSRRHDREAGLDIKARVGASTVVDLTLHPDFSQVELDRPQLAANARFGIFLREKRPFFLEGADLLETPIPLQTTRAIAHPAYGLRVTHRGDTVEALAIFSRDEGGGAILYPGPFRALPVVRHGEADVGLLRARLALADALSLGTAASWRESADGERNGVLAGDLAWQLDARHRLLMQAAASDTRHDAHPAWRDHAEPEPRQGTALFAQHSFYGARWESLVTLERVGAAFRSDNGFIAQAGHRKGQGIVGYRLGRQQWFTEVKPHLTLESSDAFADGNVYRRVRPAIQWLGPSLGLLAEAHLDQVRADRGLAAHRLPQWLASARWTPGPRLTVLQLDLEPGRRLDHANDLAGPGLRAYGELGLRLGRRTELGVVANHERIRHHAVGELLRDTNVQMTATHSLSPTGWLRLIAQAFSTTRLDMGSRLHGTARRQVGSLVYSAVPWAGAQLSLGATVVSRQDAPGAQAATREAFVKLQHRFAGSF